MLRDTDMIIIMRNIQISIIKARMTATRYELSLLIHEENTVAPYDMSSKAGYSTSF